MSPRLAAVLLLPTLLLLSACEGQLIVDISAAPPDDASSVHLAVTSVELLTSDGSLITVTPEDSNTFDLLAYTDGTTRRLIDEEADVAGDYIGLRLRFDTEDAYVTTSSGAAYPIDLLSAGEYAALSLQLDSSSSSALVVLLDLRFSLTDRREDLGHYQMIPVFRVVDADTAGGIVGSIASAQVQDSTCRAGRSAGVGVAAYLYAGADVTPLDYYDSGSSTRAAQPIASADVRLDSDGDWHFTLPFVAPGDYTVAWTCEGDDEQPRNDDGLVFRASTSVSVVEMQSSTVTFP